jgi:hypothetical protein
MLKRCYDCWATALRSPVKLVLTFLPFSPFSPFPHFPSSQLPQGFAAPELSDNSVVVGGSAWGAAAVANGDGSRAVTEKEKSVATNQAQFLYVLLLPSHCVSTANSPLYHNDSVKIVGQFVAGASA